MALFVLAVHGAPGASPSVAASKSSQNNAESHPDAGGAALADALGIAILGASLDVGLSLGASLGDSLGIALLFGASLGEALADTLGVPPVTVALAGAFADALTLAILLGLGACVLLDGVVADEFSVRDPDPDPHATHAHSSGAARTARRHGTAAPMPRADLVDATELGNSGLGSK